MTIVECFISDLEKWIFTQNAEQVWFYRDKPLQSTLSSCGVNALIIAHASITTRHITRDIRSFFSVSEVITSDWSIRIYETGEISVSGNRDIMIEEMALLRLII